MKQTFLMPALFLFSFVFAQITNTSVNKENFENSGFPYKGKRVLQVENILTPQEENYFVFSKNEHNSGQDELYIQQFKKVNGEWKVTSEQTVAEKGIMTSVWDARKSFFDADKDGQADVLFVYSKHPKGDIDTQLSVVLLLIYKNKFYRIENTAETNYDPMYDMYDFNPEDLPAAVFKEFEGYWERLDKK
ncbi:hypothetical protein [Moheibacter sediminis]|uniref:Uncharacterized protein n=1 Tax=Moheibacter sediminis TaxID=1434700 RepID=A0A1W2BDB1_9FLAO|nr:hypothetical protein [Moheibacter sediminis]SMC71003.1 hypothetical protein SAMN06296427_10690 [Moheibacter sediminis]